MKITITPMMLCSLLGGRYTLEACEAIADYYETCEEAPHIGDIQVLFTELKADEIDESYEVFVELRNGNVVVWNG